MSSWSYEQLLQLAPDTATLEQARRLFFAKRWELLEGNGEQLWGEYHTQYGHQIRAVVNFSPPQFRCSCKSPRRPCKHSLALVLLFLNRQDVWRVQDTPPDWVAKLLKTSKSTAPNRSPASGAITGRTADQRKRVALMDEGVAELEKWLRQAARQGLASLRDTASDWERMAARLVDCKLGSIARRLRRAAALLTTDDWLEPVVRELGLLYLFVRAWQDKSHLSASQKRELMQVAGWNLRKDQVLQSGTPVTDNWLVLGLETGTEEKLRYRRTWLRGEQTSHYAVLLDFAYGKQGFEAQWVVGSVLSGELVYYPGQPPLRALFRTSSPSRTPYTAPDAYPDFVQLGQAYSHALAASPWLESFPAELAAVLPVAGAEQAYLLDGDRRQLVAVLGPAFWRLLALSGGTPLRVFGAYDGEVFKPLSATVAGRVLQL
jgi:hypothetical protein